MLDILRDRQDQAVNHREQRFQGSRNREYFIALRFRVSDNGGSPLEGLLRLLSYKVDANFGKDSNGDVVLSMKLTQSGVNSDFRMLVPVYLEMADCRLLNLGRVAIIGNKTEDVKVPFPGLKQAPRRAMVNYYNDVLAQN